MKKRHTVSHGWCRAQGPWHTARQQMASQTAVTLEVRWLAHMKGKHVSDIWQGYAWVSLPFAKQRNKAKGALFKLHIVL